MPGAEVTKSAALDGRSFTDGGSSSPFGATSPIRAERSNAEMGRDFLDLAFRMESGRAIAVISRFEGPITVGVRGEMPNLAGGELSNLLARLRNEAGLDIRTVGADQPAAITIDFVPRAQMRRAVPTAACFVVPGVSSFADYKSARGTARA